MSKFKSHSNRSYEILYSHFVTHSIHFQQMKYYKKEERNKWSNRNWTSHIKYNNNTLLTAKHSEMSLNVIYAF